MTNETLSTNVDFDRAAFGCRLKEVRGELSLRAFAKLIRVSAMTVSNYEDGKRLPKVDELFRISKATGKSFAWFLTGEERGVSRAERISEGAVAYQVDKLKKAKEIIALSREIHQHLERLMKEEGEKMVAVEELLEVFPPPQFYRAVGEKKAV